MYEPRTEMRATKLAVVAVLFLYISGCMGVSEFVLALEDTFEDFNLSLWKHELTLAGGGNNEFQWYTNDRAVSYVENGVLNIKPIAIPVSDVFGDVRIWGTQPADLCTGNAFDGCEKSVSVTFLNPVKSARIRTAESFSFSYGKVEVRAKLPIGDWLWPAVSLLPTYNQYGDWPASGQITVMESRGNEPLSDTSLGYNAFSSTLYWGPNYLQNKFSLTSEAIPVDLYQNFTADFHTFGLIWNETYIGTYLDDESNPVLQVPITESFFTRGGWDPINWSNPWRGREDNAPFDRRFYLVLGLAVGGRNGYFPDAAYGQAKPWTDTSITALNEFFADRDQWLPTWTQPFQIDSVRVWKYSDMSGPSARDLLVQAYKNRCGCIKDTDRSCL